MFTFCLSYKNNFPLKVSIKENLFYKARFKYYEYLISEYGIYPNQNYVKWINNKKYEALKKEVENAVHS